MTSIERRIETQRPTIATIRFEDFSPEILREIAEIYKEINGCEMVVDTWMPLGLEKYRHKEIIEQWARGKFDTLEYKFGSTLSLDSKLKLKNSKIIHNGCGTMNQTIDISFAGYLKQDTPQFVQEKAQQMSEDFAARVQERIGYSAEEALAIT